MLPLSPKVAVAAALLEREPFVSDPASRPIHGTVRDGDAQLVTRNSRIREFDPRGAVW